MQKKQFTWRFPNQKHSPYQNKSGRPTSIERETDRQNDPRHREREPDRKTDRMAQDNRKGARERMPHQQRKRETELPTSTESKNLTVIFLLPLCMKGDI